MSFNSTMSMVKPGKLVEALAGELLQNADLGIQRMIGTKAKQTGQQLMIHGNKRRNHEVREMTTVYGTMMVT